MDLDLEKQLMNDRTFLLKTTSPYGKKRAAPLQFLAIRLDGRLFAK